MSISIAMWSGPRNISTAMMRSFEGRGDCFVSDEPLYAHYLHETQRQHPGFDAIIRSQSTDWKQVTRRLAGEIPNKKQYWYQKHMTHHMLPMIGHEWLAQLRHCFLIRDPRMVLSSYAKRRAEVSFEDLGFVEQKHLFEVICQDLGHEPLVIDSRDVLRSPEAVLSRLCDRLGIPFRKGMLQWNSGPRKTDGVWAKYWYDAVEQSTGFAPYRERQPDYPKEYQSIVEQAMPIYRQLFRYRITA